MPQTVKSVLFIDYDSIHQALEARQHGAGAFLASRAETWLAAIENGDLITPRLAPGDRRRLLVKRCYADPQLLGKGRGAFITNGVQTIDCPAIANGPGHAPHAHLVLDAIDALEHTTGFDEFILLSASADLTPLLFRLRAHNRETVIYGHSETPAAYRASADALLDEGLLLRMLRDAEPAFEDGEDESRDEPVRAARSAPKGRSLATRGHQVPAPIGGNDRERLVALARRVSEATRVPLFSSKVYADLFRQLVQEIADNGYRFQTTAENVAVRLDQLGRSVTRRQVGFVVKGLALKGHVFAAEDTPETLGSVFHQQILYLARQAGLNLSADEENRLGAWILGGFGAPAAERRLASRPAPRRVIAPPPPPMPEPEIDEEEEDEPVAEITPPPPPQRPAPAEKPVPMSRLARARAAAAARAEAAAASFRPRAGKPAATEEPADEADTNEYTRPTLVSVRAAASEAPAKPTRRRSARQAPVVAEPEPVDIDLDMEPASEPDEMENSIIAAIAQAVDVLVEPAPEEDEAPLPVEPRPAPAPRRTRQSASEQPPAPPPFLTEEAEDSDELGDEIQRILAGYKDSRG